MNCGQMAGLIKMPRGMEVGVGLGHIVLHWDPAPPQKGAQPQIFGPCPLWPNGRASQLLLSTCCHFFCSWPSLWELHVIWLGPNKRTFGIIEGFLQAGSYSLQCFDAVGWAAGRAYGP